MAQRLTIEIKEKGEILANAFYYYGAYTRTALRLTVMIANELERLKELPDYQERNSTLKAIRLLESTGAALPAKEKEYVLKNFESFRLSQFKDFKNDELGRLSISSEGIENTREIDEGRVTIDLDTEEVLFDVCFTYDKDDYLEDYETTEEDHLELPVNNLDLLRFYLDEAEELKDYVFDLVKNGVYEYRNDSGDVFTFIA